MCATLFQPNPTNLRSYSGQSCLTTTYGSKSASHSTRYGVVAVRHLAKLVGACPFVHTWYLENIWFGRIIDGSKTWKQSMWRSVESTVWFTSLLFHLLVCSLDKKWMKLLDNTADTKARRGCCTCIAPEESIFQLLHEPQSRANEQLGLVALVLGKDTVLLQDAALRILKMSDFQWALPSRLPLTLGKKMKNEIFYNYRLII